MFFSLFGRKKTESKKAPITRQPAKHSPEKSAEGPQTGDDSLDFSAYVPPPPSAPPQVSAAPATAAPPLDVSALASSLVKDPVPSIEASPAANDVAPIIEEAATLFANGQVEQALARLSNSVREEDLGNSSQQAWLMLFDLY